MKFLVRLVFNTLVPLLLIFGAVQVARQITAAPPQPERVPRAVEALLVETETVHADTVRARIPVQGMVMPSRQVTLAPEVSARVLERHPRLELGGLVQRGETLLRMDATAFRLAVQERETDLASARINVELEEGRQQVATQEWALFDADGATPPPLAVRAPQMASAQTAVQASQARLERARLDQRRTTLVAPFDGVVLQQGAEVGQLVGPGVPVVTLVDSSRFWIQVQVPVDRVPELEIPGYNAEVGSLALVRQEQGGEVMEREARVLRLLPELDPQGRMARILVEVEDPLLLAQASAPLRAQGWTPLLINAWVPVELESRMARPVVRLPRTLLRNGRQVWVMTADGTLDVRTVEVVGRTREEVLVGAGLADGEVVVSSWIETPVRGMALRTAAPAAARQEDP
jgi:RND family efflux transporter MFP subunit